MGKINNKCKLGRERECEVRFLVNKTNRYNDKDQPSPSTHYSAAAPSWLDFKHNLRKRKRATIIKKGWRGFSPYIFLMPFWLILLISEIFETRIDETRKPTPSNKYLTTTKKYNSYILRWTKYGKCCSRVGQLTLSWAFYVMSWWAKIKLSYIMGYSA